MTQFITPVEAKPQYTSSRIFFILDMSGSMWSVCNDTIGGFNAFLEEQKAVGIPTTMTVVLFNGKYIVLHDNVPIENIPPLTNEVYIPGGGTNLYDSIGKTIADNYVSIPGQKTVFSILTDGEENSSREYTHAAVKSLIEDVQKKDWEVLFVGANIDAAIVGGGMGVRLSKTASFAANGKGVTDIMKSAAYASNVSRGMTYDWMEKSVVGASFADASGGLNMNTVYASVAKGEDEVVKAEFNAKK